MSSQVKKIATSAVFIFFLLNSSLQGSQLSVSNEVQANIKLLNETKNCPGCDLKGAVLNRFELEGANLEGADLSRAKLFLANLSRANLKNTNLSEAQFGGADLANADLRGANLTATSFAGAYMVGTLLDGEMISTKPYAADDISHVEEDVYVEDTVKPKVLPSTEDINIGSRRDFEETSQEVIVEKQQQEPETVEAKTVGDATATVNVPEEDRIEEAIEDSVPEVSSSSPGPKPLPAIQSVHIEEKVDETIVERVEEYAVEKEDQEVDALFETTHAANANNSTPVNDSSPLNTNDEGMEVAPHSESVKEITTEAQRDVLESDVESPVVGDVKETVVENETSEAHLTDSVVQSDTNVDIQDSNDAVETMTPVEVDVSAESKSAVTVEEAATKESPSVSEEEVVDVASLNQEQIVIETQETATVETVQNVAKSIPAIEEIQTLSKEVYANMERLLDGNSCYGCDLTDVNLSGENLDSADLEAAILANAILTGADLEQANLKGADLRGANLRDADLREADLYKANLSGADLTGAKLKGALLDDADLRGVKGYLPAVPLLPGQ